MRIEDYPAQEPFTAIGAKYHAEVLRRAGTVVPTEDAYGPDPYQRIAVVPAERPTGIVLAALHGGGWTNGYKEWMLFMAPAFAPFGITFVSIGYRLAPQTIFPDNYDDVLAAIVALHRHAPSWGGDPANIFLTGHSAGAHLAALAALRDDWQAPRGLPRDVVRGALPISGTYLFGPGSGLSMRPRFLGPSGEDVEAAASPLNHIGRHPAPFLVAVGGEDFPHLRRQADDFTQALAMAGNVAELLELPGCDHLGASYASAEPDGIWATAARAFLTRHATGHSAR